MTKQVKCQLWLQTAASLVCLLVAGCATQPTTATFSGTERAQHQEQQGLSLAVETVSDPAQLKELFGTGNVGRGVLFVFVRARNDNPTKSFILPREVFRIAGASSGVKKPDESTDMWDVIENGPIWASYMQAAAGTLRHNLEAREFKTTTLVKGDTASGFIYFAIPSETREPVLNVKATESGTGAPLKFQFKLNP